MTEQIALLLAIIVVTLVLFSLERLPADVIALGVLLTLILTNLIPIDQAFAGFGNSAVMMIFGLFILTAALVRTGVVDMVGRAIYKFTGDNSRRLLGVIMAGAAALSAVMSNTATTAFFTPISIGLAHRLRISVSKLLMPLAFASILASSVTVISSSTNVVISGLLIQHDMEPFGMFELSLVGIPIVLVGLAYMLFIGQHLMPDRGGSETLAEEFSIRPYLTEILIAADSPLVGKTLAEAGLGHDLDLTVLQIVRSDQRHLAPQANLRIEEGDVLLVQGQRDNVLKIKNASGIAIKADIKLSDPDLETKDTKLAEAIIMRRSPLIGRTLEQVGFREQYGVQVLGINRRGKVILRKISQISLQAGDELLIQGRHSKIVRLDENDTLRIVGMVNYERPNRHRAPVAVAIFAGVLLIAALDIIPLPVAVLMGALVTFITGCITPDEAYRSVEWKALLVIGCMLTIGIAMEITGTAAFLATQIIGMVGEAGPIWLLTAFFTLTLLLTQPMSNQAAAVVVIPIALQTALQLDLNPRTFAVMIAVAASCSYLTPLEPSCLIVYGPGRYRFVDFLKVGALLTLITYAIAIVLVPLFWPL
ncbi:MAG: SLC13 family permease [Anaerolineae bacterium]|nr:SLC13 family permease [Anaerolineae bacterium]